MSLSIMRFIRNNLPNNLACAMAAGLMLTALAACAPSGGATRAATIGSPATTDPDRYSVYDLDAHWRDQRGNARQLSSLRGRPQVVAMIYTHCSTTCPFTVAEMKRIERESPRDVGFVLVSLDPARDDPARLAAFASERGRRWHEPCLQPHRGRRAGM